MALSPRVKSLLLLLATLAIGVVLGGILQARLAQERMERIAAMRTSRGFLRFMEGTIEPADAAQREAVRAILERAAGRVASVMEDRRAEIQAIVDSARAELGTVLTEEQMRQFEERMATHRQLFRERRGFGRPHGQGLPGQRRPRGQGPPADR